VEQAGEDKSGQWPRICQSKAGRMGGKAQHQDPRYPTGQAPAENIYRAL